MCWTSTCRIVSHIERIVKLLFGKKRPNTGKRLSALAFSFSIVVPEELPKQTRVHMQTEFDLNKLKGDLEFLDYSLPEELR